MPFYRNVKTTSGGGGGSVLPAQTKTYIPTSVADPPQEVLPDNGYVLSSVTVKPQRHDTQYWPPIQNDSSIFDMGEYNEYYEVYAGDFFNLVPCTGSEAKTFNLGHSSNVTGNMRAVYSNNRLDDYTYITQINLNPLSHTNAGTYSNTSYNETIDLGQHHNTRYLNLEVHRFKKFEWGWFISSTSSQTTITFEKAISNFAYFTTNSTDSSTKPTKPGTSMGFWIRSPANIDDASGYAYYCGSGTYSTRYSLPNTTNWRINSVASDYCSLTMNKTGSANYVVWFAIYW